MYTAKIFCLISPNYFMLSNIGIVSATLNLADPRPIIPAKGTPTKASPTYSVTAPNT